MSNFPSYFKKKELPQEPTLSIPPTFEEINGLINYFRLLNDADESYGQDKCEKVNLGLLRHVKKNYPEIKFIPIGCRDYRRIKRREGQMIEHYVGAIKSEEGWVWFDGTADQLSFAQPGTKVIIQKTSEDELFAGISQILGGNWERCPL